MKLKNTAMLLVLSVLLSCVSGCATGPKGIKDQKAVSSADTIQPGKAYLYGRFHLDKRYKSLGKEPVRLWLKVSRPENGQCMFLPFKTEDDIYAIEVEREDYQIAGVLIFNRGDLQTLPLPAEGFKFMQNPLRVAPGKAYYLGDFAGVIVRIPGYTYQYVTAESVSWNPLQTTEEFKKRFPQFADMEALPAWMNP
jgi:hypothetical protein